MTNEKQIYYAHSPKEGNGEWEPLSVHLEAVAKKAAEFAKNFSAGQLGRIAGLLHDIGKNQDSFQKKLKGQHLDIDHAICGAQEALRLFKQAEGSSVLFKSSAEILAYIIAGHHTGLPNLLTSVDDYHTQSPLAVRLKNKTEDYSAYKDEIVVPSPSENWVELFANYHQNDKFFAISFFVKMLYSALVDADSLETEKFYTKRDRNYNCSSFETLKKNLDRKLDSFPDPPKGKINQHRKQILEACKKMSNRKKGVFSLTVPTGGGKTLASMAFALNHLIANGHKRIVYCIPFLTIADQTASIFKGIFGSQNVLVHTSNAVFEDDENFDTPHFLATENWEQYPIIITSNVQFFESLFSNKRGTCRKLHNISNSVVIFDEVQTLPETLLKPCLKAVDVLTRSFGCTTLLMSATVPNYLPFLCDGAEITEINDNFLQHYKDFKRVEVEYIGKKTNKELVELIDYNSQTLVVVNTRKHAKNLFETLPENCNKYHLSTLMLIFDRESVLQKIRDDLSAGKPCVVVSTSLIECGIDLDFDTVFRSLAGVDSLVQAGGRCNREGKKHGSKVYVFESDEDPQKGELVEYKSLSKPLCENPLDGDIFSLSNIQRYFDDLLSYKFNVADKFDILKMFRYGSGSPFIFNFDFASCGNAFKYIDSANKCDIVIAVEPIVWVLLEQLKDKKDFKTDKREVLRQLQKYTVSVYKWEADELRKHDKVKSVEGADRMFVLLDIENYDSEIGLNLKSNVSNKKIYIV